MVEFKDDGQKISVYSDCVLSGELSRWKDFDGKTIWLFDGSVGAMEAEEMKQIAEYMMTINESEAA